jgi:cellulose synthase/poly-beta-1,6-N-acetylglucosamine synthase-like glycosyltransferase
MLRTPPRPVAPRVPITFSKQPTSTNPDVERYREYLVKHVTRSPDIRSEQEYAHRANAIHQYRGKQVHTFAPFHPERSAVRTWTPAQIALCSVLAVLVVLGFILIGLSTLTILFAVVTVLYTALLGLSVAWIAGTSKPAPVTPFDENTIAALARAPWPTYTILCPLYREKAIVPQFVEAMRALDYPADCLQVLFLTESDDDETRRAILALRLPDNFNVLTVPPGTPRTKPRACNYGLLHATGEYVVIYDAEDVPDPLQLKKAVLTFASVAPEVACVQAKLNYYNPHQNILTRWFTVEYSLWFDLILPGLQRIGFALPLGGTSNHFRASMLRALGAWDAFNVTEDCDLGLKLAEQGLQTVVMDSTTYEEANSRPLSWIKQRSRWIKGYMQTYLVHTRHPLKSLRRGKIKDALSLHLFVGTGSMILLINPIMWAMFAVYLVWRPVALYHQLFPWPVLYAGMGCFLLGNFLPVYASMVACVKREHYGLVKWCLLLPLYWVLASIAAFMAGYELFTAPHRWHKTAHGLHLKSKGDTSKVAAVKAQTMQQGVTSSAVAMAGVTAAVRAMPTVLTPAVKSAKAKGRKARDPWLVLLIAVASLCGILATLHFYQLHELLLYDDASSHLRIARAVYDNITPGLAQLGSVWLPLPQILLMPFVSNDFLWHTGLAGAFVSTPCYVISAVYIFLLARKVAGSNVGGILGVSVFLFNPNILYLQSTPLSELVCIASIVGATYHLYAWMEKYELRHLIAASSVAFLSALVRYDGWVFAMFAVFIFVALSLIYKSRRRLIRSHLLVFAITPVCAMLLWFIWNQAIWGDFLYFQRGAYSAQTAQQSFLAQDALPTYHNAFQSIRYFSLTVFSTLGVVILILAALALLLMVFRERRLTVILLLASALLPALFYTFSLYTGQIIIYIPSAITEHMDLRHFFNVRYGVVAVFPACLCVALLTKYVTFRRLFPLRSIMFFVLIIGIMAQSVYLMRTGVITIQDGQHGLACAPYHQSYDYLARHYSGGEILESMNGAYPDATEAGLDFRDIVYQGSGIYWKTALSHPQKGIDWIVTSPNDLVVKNVNVQSLNAYFSLVVSEPGGVKLYHRNGGSISTHAPFAWSLWTNRTLCPQ